MSIPLQGRLMWRRTAPFHVQLALLKTRGLEQVAGETQVEGQVIRVFRTDGRLTAGDRIRFPLWVCQPGDEPTGPAYIYCENFVKAAYMEAYLYGSPPECKLAAYEYGVIGSPTEQPTLSLEQLEYLSERYDEEDAETPRILKTTKWWRFWAARRGA